MPNRILKESICTSANVDALTAEEATFAQSRRDTLDVIESTTVSTSAASAAAEVRGELRSLRSGLERAEADLRRQVARLDSLDPAMLKDGDVVLLEVGHQVA